MLRYPSHAACFALSLSLFRNGRTPVFSGSLMTVCSTLHSRRLKISSSRLHRKPCDSLRRRPEHPSFQMCPAAEASDATVVEESPTYSWRKVFENIAAGAAAGAMSVAVIHPFDTLKTLVQSNADIGTHSSVFALAVSVMASHGFLGLYAGLPSALLGAAPSAAIRITLFDAVHSILKRALPGSFSGPVPFFAGAVAGFCCCLSYVPSEVLKQRMQTGMFSTLVDAFHNATAFGFSGLYAGFWPTVARDLPFNFIELPVFWKLKQLASDRLGGRQLKPHENLFLGGLAGALANLLTTPADVIKTTVMLGFASTIPDAISVVVGHSGIPGLMSGAVLRCLMGIPTSAVFFLVYESVKKVLAGTRFRRSKERMEERPDAPLEPSSERSDTCPEASDKRSKRRLNERPGDRPDARLEPSSERSDRCPEASDERSERRF